MDEEAAARVAYEVWLGLTSPGISHPWDGLDDEHRDVWRQIVKKIAELASDTAATRRR